MRDPWSISSSQVGDGPEGIMRQGNIYQIANGYMGYRGTLDEFGPEQMVGITLAGIFDRVGEAWREPVNAPNGGFTRVTVDGCELSALGGPVTQHRQTLGFAQALFSRETAFAVAGKQVILRSQRFLSADRPNVGVIQFSVQCDQAAEVVVRSGIDGHIWDLNGPHLPKLKLARSGPILVAAGQTNENGQPGEGEAVRRAAIAAAKAAQALGFAGCRAAHEAEWQRRWERSDVAIDGDDEAQCALRYSILQLLMVAPLPGSANSIPARALSGQSYKGAIFWDTEMFMFPFFLHTRPETARELMRYRIKTLGGARRKARTEGPGYRGAFYAWESQESGDDACTYFNIGDPLTGRDLRTYFRDKQVHISGDVALSMWAYFRQTGDDSLLLAGGAEVILECARFYFSAAYYKVDKRRFELLDVVGPDEYHERVNNNAFTNMVARETLSLAGATVAYLERTHPAALRRLLAKLRMAKELPALREAARQLFVPAPAAKSGVIEQFDGYLGLQETTVAALKARKKHPNEYLGTGQGLAAPTKIIKQADVVMMLTLFRDRFSTAVKRANWQYYEPRTEHGSSLSACAYAMVATEIGDLDQAYRYFLETAKIDLEAKYKVYVGNVFMGGSHPAANGGAWMTAVLGFGGVQAAGPELTLTPRLPRQWRGLRFNVASKGDSFHVEVTRRGTTVTAAAANRRSRRVRVGGRSILCRPGQPVKVAAAG